MALADKATNPPAKKTRCTFRDWKQSLPLSEQEAVDTMLADVRWTVEAMTQEFSKAGCPVSDGRVRDHRVGGCKACNS